MNNFEDRLVQIIEHNCDYASIKAGEYHSLTESELAELCVLYAREDAEEQRLSDGFTVDTCDNVNDLVRSVAKLCIGLVGDELSDTLEDIKKIATESFVKNYGSIIIEIYDKKVYEHLNNAACGNTEWDFNEGDEALFAY